MIDVGPIVPWHGWFIEAIVKKLAEYEEAVLGDTTF